MKQDEEKKVLQEIWRNARGDLDMIDAVISSVYDEDLAYDLNRKALKMREFLRKSTTRLNQQGEDVCEHLPGAVMRKKAVHVRTMLQGETAQLAKMMQDGSKNGAERLKNSIHRYKDAGIYATELAKEMIDFEEESQRKLNIYREQ